MAQNRFPINPEFRYLLEHYFREDLRRVTVHQGFFARCLTRGLGVRGVTLGNRILIAPEVEFDDYPFGFLLAAHEVVHVLQYRRQGFLRFLARYGRDFLRGIFSRKTVGEAYRRIPAEVEAYAIEEAIRKQIMKHPEIGEICRRADCSWEDRITLLEERKDFFASFRGAG